jgi:tetratricopeptide (TPR) repeat protein
VPASGVLMLALIGVVAVLSRMGEPSSEPGDGNAAGAATIAVLPFENLGPPAQEKLGVTLAFDERSPLRAQPTTNHEAYTLYLKGRYFWNRRTEENIQTALDYFEQAVSLDPGYALAWVGIADAWIFRGWYSQVTPRDAFPRAKTAVRRALEFEEALAEAHASLARIHLEFDYDWGAAEREYRRAIALNPRYAIAHHCYGGFLSAMGRHDDALREAETARSLDPLSLIVQTWLGLRYYFARRYDDAIAEYHAALELDRDFAPAHWHLAQALQEAGRTDDGVAAARQALALDPESLLYLAGLGQAYARAGMTSEARTTLTRLAEASAERHVSAYQVAAIHAALGDTIATLDWLEQAYDERSPWFGYLGVDPRFDVMRTEARLRQLVSRAALPGAAVAAVNGEASRKWSADGLLCDQFSSTKGSRDCRSMACSSWQRA